jgi:predicted cobalt transporter CbtA
MDPSAPQLIPAPDSGPSVAWWFASIALSAVGAGLFVYGRKEGRWPHLVVGVLLCIYPYFVPSPWVTAAIGAGLLGVLWLLVRRGA